MEKILIVNNNMNIGGVQKSLVNLLRCISSEYDVTLLLFHRSGALLDDIPKNVKVLSVGAPYAYLGMSDAETNGHFIRKLGRSFYAATARLFGFGVSAAWMAPFQKKLRGFDVAVSFLHSGAPKAFYGGCNEFVLRHVEAKRKVTFLHCDFAKIGANTARNQRIYARFDRIASCSEGCRAAFLAVFPEFAEKTLTVENCQDFAQIVKKAEAAPVAPRTDCALHVVTVARLGREKGVLRGVEALAALRDERVHYTVIGDGVERAEIEAAVEKYALQKQVTLLGELENPYGYIKAADLLLIPSYSEAAPMVIDEAACLGTPILTTATSSADDMVAKTGYGWVCENSVQGICDGLSALLAEPQRLLQRREFLKKKHFGNDAALDHFRRLTH